MQHYNLIKIGKTRNPAQRLENLNVARSSKISLLCAVVVRDYSAVETELHRKYNHRRVKCEWFNLTKEDISHILTRLQVEARNCIIEFNYDNDIPITDEDFIFKRLSVQLRSGDIVKSSLDTIRGTDGF